MLKTIGAAVILTSSVFGKEKTREKILVERDRYCGHRDRRLRNADSVDACAALAEDAGCDSFVFFFKSSNNKIYLGTL